MSITQYTLGKDTTTVMLRVRMAMAAWSHMIAGKDSHEMRTMMAVRTLKKTVEVFPQECCRK